MAIDALAIRFGVIFNVHKAMTTRSNVVNGGHFVLPLLKTISCCLSKMTSAMSPAAPPHLESRINGQIISKILEAAVIIGSDLSDF